MTPEQRQQRAEFGRLGAYTSWANTTDATARTAPARAAFNDRFERQVDPNRELPAAERARRADAARKAFFLRLSLASKKARARRRKGAA
ncbi:hypothetical protein NLX83_39750 [Allokutzneria sp. A3M-2-11 16]|uniref:hypothetical protein n=1 Tax=Allokutzneria sp. A3M-2-11 16 TaxID=2962043 RepID=UPI0020B6DED3|nr:hypothetical protein [Allokutzneria sp. A3M-2-11 16]MCP3805420.1 hypothetical protein [Allokutzneria sp. A3M-2-11 16]